MIRQMTLILAAGALATSAQAQSVLELAKVSQDWARAWQAKDLDATLRLYADDAVFFDTSGERFSGRARLRTFFATVLAQYSAQPKLDSLRSVRSGALGYDWGDYTEVVTPVAHPDQAIRTGGSYLVVLRKVAGRWLITEQIWTGSTPVPVNR